MKVWLLALVGLALSTSALAEDPNSDAEQNVYASQLCHLVSSEKSTGTMDSYVAKMKAQMASGQAEFDEEMAQEVISGWMQLDDEERSQLRHNQQQCEQTVMTQFQQED
ncbi:enkurin domain-containing protein [Pantoea sp. At-9b]|uniref:enkurin domain-containing protein n=1 Tax=Pantoea sp. (strain At-9b) TaxID=592316 RepID=UPI0001B40E19|nr:enkurin domain-containing protein [Pantoea sp. At-9b]ADU71066.1 hypothetical protein Pat9b_3776 [Pantoea sp. At-9b]